MLKEKRMEVLNVINHMEKSICKPCGVIDTATCNKCPIGFEFKKLGDRLLEISNTKNEKILSKGNDMTIKDIERLLDKGVTRSRISKAIGQDVSKIIGAEERVEIGRASCRERGQIVEVLEIIQTETQDEEESCRC